MRRFLALIQREALNLTLNPPTHFAAAFFILLDSFAFYLIAVRSQTPTANFHSIATFMLYTSLIMHPFAARHSLSAENANGTLETLFAAPVSRLCVVLAKYSALLLFALAYLSHGLVYAVLFAQAGNLDWGVVLSSLAALCAVAALAMAVSLFVSALTNSPAASVAGSAGILLVMALAADLDPYSGFLPDILHAISFVPHAKRWFGGLFDTRGLIFFATVAALFLFYAWLVVSTQESDRRPHGPTVRRRLTITYLLVSTGLFLFLFQAAILNIGGYWDAGGQLGHNLARIPKLYLLPTALALVVFLWSAFTWRAARRAHRQARSKRGTTKYVTISESKVQRAPRYYYEENVRARRRTALAALAALVITVNLNWLAHYPFRTFADGGKLSFLAALQAKSRDMTRERKNTLAPATIRALDSLQGKLGIYSFLPENLRLRGVPIVNDLRSLVARYADINALVAAVYADTRREPEFARELALELDIPPEDLENRIVLEYQGRHALIHAETLAAAPDHRQPGAGDTQWVFDGENKLTQAILHLVDPRVPRVFFTYGHLEHSLAAGAAQTRSVSRLVQALAGANIRSRQHSLTAGPIPDDCDILAVLAPQRPFSEESAAEIARFLERGGSLLVAAPAPTPGKSLRDDPLNRLLFDLGGSFRDDRLRDPEHNDDDPSLLFGRAITGNVEEAHLLFPDPRSIRDNPRSSELGWFARRLAQTHSSAVATTSGTSGETSGPFTLAYRSIRHTPSGEARVLVLSSSGAITNAYLNNNTTMPLLLANVQWLAGREEATDIEARAWVNRRLRWSGPLVRTVIWIALVALPLLWLAAGVSAWWMRRE